MSLILVVNPQRSTFQYLHVIEKVMTGLKWEICVIYLDDMIIVGKTFEDIIKNPKPVFDRLLEAGLKLKARKCTTRKCCNRSVVHGSFHIG